MNYDAIAEYVWDNVWRKKQIDYHAKHLNSVNKYGNLTAKRWADLYPEERELVKEMIKTACGMVINGIRA